MIAIYIFFAVQLLASGYAGWRGGAPERWVAGLLLAAAALTALVPFDYWISFRRVNTGILWIDLGLLVALVVVAVRADRFWPLWLAALHLLAIMMHGVRVHDPHLWSLAYWFIEGKIAYPMLAVLVLGTARHRHRRLAGMPEFAWTAQRHAHERGPVR